MLMEGHFKPCFSKKNWIGRFLWGLVWGFLFRPSPRLAHGWRRMWLRCFGARIGRGTRVYPDVKIWAPWNFECGEYCILGDGAQFVTMARIRLGDRVIVSQEVYFATGSHETTTANFELIAQEIVVGSRVWIAARAFIMAGVTIGDGAVIGAQSLVNKDVDEWTIVGGNPIRYIKKREWFESGDNEGR